MVCSSRPGLSGRRHGNSLGTSAIKANVCDDCASVLKLAQKKRSKRKSTRKEAEQHPDVADTVDDEAVDAEPEEEKKENQSAVASVFAVSRLWQNPC